MTAHHCCDEHPSATGPRRLTPASLIMAIALWPLGLFLKAIVWAWRFFGSPIAGPVCRFEPSCSAYALEALERFGPIHGTLLTVKRLARCHPWGGSGYDPVPPTRSF